jgi:erythronate-4-phosphate dehydrogenase
MLTILADENIPYVHSAFSLLGKVRTFHGRKLSPSDLGDAEILLVRSITSVNENLLKNSAISFVGTATAGYDHIDLEYLKANHIAFADASGSNAISVAEYIVSAVLIIAENQGFKLNEKTVGIIGCGHVGKQVFNKFKALGITCLINDPPLQEKTGSTDYVDLNTVLSADIITLHVPLEKIGKYPTYHLVNSHFLSRVQKNVLLINTSRGDVVDETALVTALDNHPEMTIILDVWQNEPYINVNLLKKIALGTAHIAGYSLDGKVRGTEMLYESVCNYLNNKVIWKAEYCLPAPPIKQLSFSETMEDERAIYTAVCACYDVRRDSSALHLINKSKEYGQFFDNLRKNYPVRREFSTVHIELPAEREILAKKFNELGFKC